VLALPAIGACVPNEGTIGTQVTVTGTGFGVLGGKVRLAQGGLTVGSWKVVTWADTSILCALRKPPSYGPGLYDVMVFPKGGTPITLSNAFRVVPPEIGEITPISGLPEATITVSGHAFGAKKPKVQLRDPAGALGPKSCKVVTWTMDVTTNESSLQFLVTNHLPPAVYDFVLTNRVDSDAALNAFEVLPAP
jgi:hypothetical protein